MTVVSWGYGLAWTLSSSSYIFVEKGGGLFNITSIQVHSKWTKSPLPVTCCEIHSSLRREHRLLGPCESAAEDEDLLGVIIVSWSICTWSCTWLLVELDVRA